MSAVAIEDAGYPMADWPFTFYFNGETLPKWSACWPGRFLHKHADPLKEWDDEVGDRDVYHISTKIDHYGTIESAPPAIFLFVVQRVLQLVLEYSDEAAVEIRGFQGSPDPSEVIAGLIEGGFRMRELVLRDGLALWTSGYAADQAKLESFRAQLGSQPGPLQQFPHQAEKTFLLRICLEIQIKQCHRLAQSGTLGKADRARLHQLVMPDESFLKLVA